MQKLIKYPYGQDKPYFIAGVTEGNTLLSFTVADKNLERYTEKNFRNAGKAIEWADENYKGLV